MRVSGGAWTDALLTHVHQVEDFSMRNHTLATVLRRAMARFRAILAYVPLNRIEPRHSPRIEPAEIRDAAADMAYAASRDEENHAGSDGDSRKTLPREHPKDVRDRGSPRLGDPKTSIADSPQIPAAEHILDGLPERTVQIFLLSQEEGRTYREIAGLLGVSQRKVRQHMRRAIAYIAARR